MQVEQAAVRFASIGSEPRLEVLQTLVRAFPNGLTVGEVQDRSGLAASTLAHHLRTLTTAGLIEQEREGRSVVNRACIGKIEALAAYLLQECCVDATDELAVKRDCR